MSQTISVAPGLPRVHVRHWRGDPARPALALHCMMGSAAYWGPIAERLEGRIDLRGFDLPGHGRSAAFEPGDLDYHTTVTRIAAAMIDRPLDLIGHSLGATVALRIAVGAPEAVRTLTLIEPVLFAAAGGREGLAASETAHAGALLEAGGEEAATRAFLADWGAQGYDTLPARVRKQLRQQIHLVAAADEALSGDSARILRPGGLEGIAAPVMLILGAESPPIIPAIAAALAARLPDVGRATVPGAGHMLPLTHVDAVAGLIAANLDRG